MLPFPQDRTLCVWQAAHLWGRKGDECEGGGHGALEAVCQVADGQRSAAAQGRNVQHYLRIMGGMQKSWGAW